MLNKRVLIAFICGAFIGCLYTCILADITMKYEHEMLKSSLYEQTQQTHEWMNRFEEACNERDILSDCIRAFHDEQECEEHGDPIYSVCHDIMPAINRDTTDLGNWSYCY